MQKYNPELQNSNVGKHDGDVDDEDHDADDDESKADTELVGWWRVLQ